MEMEMASSEAMVEIRMNLGALFDKDRFFLAKLHLLTNTFFVWSR